MYMRQIRKTPTVTAPTYSVVPSQNRLSIVVRDIWVLPLVSDTIRRAALDSSYGPSMHVIVDCRRCRPSPGMHDIRELAVTLANSCDVAGPVAVLVTDRRIAEMRYALDMTLSPWAACQLQVFDCEESMNSWLAGSATAL